MILLKAAVQLLVMLLSVNVAAAASLSAFKATPTDSAGNAVGGTELADAFDGDMSTAYTTSHVADRALGHGVRFDFDVSGFQNISALSYDLNVVYRSDNFEIQSLWHGPTRNFANLFSSVPAPINQMISLSQTAVAGGLNVTDIDQYLTVPDILSIWVQTAIGFGPGSFTQIDFLEINVDITADMKPAVVPLPAGLPLLVFALGGFLIIRHGRKI